MIALRVKTATLDCLPSLLCPICKQPVAEGEKYHSYPLGSDVDQENDDAVIDSMVRNTWNGCDDPIKRDAHCTCVEQLLTPMRGF